MYYIILDGHACLICLKEEEKKKCAIPHIKLHVLDSLQVIGNFNMALYWQFAILKIRTNYYMFLSCFVIFATEM